MTHRCCDPPGCRHSAGRDDAEQVTTHLDAAYDNNPSRELLDELGFDGYGKLRRCTDRNGTIVDFYLYLAAALLTVRRLIQRARTHYRWDTRPTVRRLK